MKKNPFLLVLLILAAGLGSLLATATPESVLGSIRAQIISSFEYQVAQNPPSREHTRETFRVGNNTFTMYFFEPPDTLVGEHVPLEVEIWSYDNYFPDTYYSGDSKSVLEGSETLEKMRIKPAVKIPGDFSKGIKTEEFDTVTGEFSKEEKSFFFLPHDQREISIDEASGTINKTPQRLVRRVVSLKDIKCTKAGLARAQFFVNVGYSSPTGVTLPHFLEFGDTYTYTVNNYLSRPPASGVLDSPSFHCLADVPDSESQTSHAEEEDPFKNAAALFIGGRLNEVGEILIPGIDDRPPVISTAPSTTGSGVDSRALFQVDLTAPRSAEIGQTVPVTVSIKPTGNTHVIDKLAGVLRVQGSAKAKGDWKLRGKLQSSGTVSPAETKDVPEDGETTYNQGFGPSFVHSYTCESVGVGTFKYVGGVQYQIEASGGYTYIPISVDGLHEWVSERISATLGILCLEKKEESTSTSLSDSDTETESATSTEAQPEIQTTQGPTVSTGAGFDKRTLFKTELTAPQTAKVGETVAVNVSIKPTGNTHKIDALAGPLRIEGSAVAKGDWKLRGSLRSDGTVRPTETKDLPSSGETTYPEGFGPSFDLSYTCESVGFGTFKYTGTVGYRLLASGGYTYLPISADNLNTWASESIEASVSVRCEANGEVSSGVSVPDDQGQTVISTGGSDVSIARSTNYSDDHGLYKLEVEADKTKAKVKESVRIQAYILPQKSQELDNIGSGNTRFNQVAGSSLSPNGSVTPTKTGDFGHMRFHYDYTCAKAGESLIQVNVPIFYSTQGVNGLIDDEFIGNISIECVEEADPSGGLVIDGGKLGELADSLIGSSDQITSSSTPDNDSDESKEDKTTSTSDSNILITTGPTHTSAPSTADTDADADTDSDEEKEGKDPTRLKLDVDIDTTRAFGSDVDEQDITPELVQEASNGGKRRVTIDVTITAEVLSGAVGKLRLDTQTNRDQDEELQEAGFESLIYIINPTLNDGSGKDFDTVDTQYDDRLEDGGEPFGLANQIIKDIEENKGEYRFTLELDPETYTMAVTYIQLTNEKTGETLQVPIYLGTTPTATEPKAVPPKAPRTEQSEEHDIEEITVTAGRRDSGTFDTPAPVTAAHMEAFMGNGNSVQDFFYGGVPSIPGITIRGLGDPIGTGTVLFNDNIFTNSSVLAEFGFDFGRVEILKGPQGALFGAAESGVVNVIGEAPKTTTEKVPDGSGTSLSSGEQKGAQGAGKYELEDSADIWAYFALGFVPQELDDLRAAEDQKTLDANTCPSQNSGPNQSQSKYQCYEDCLAKTHELCLMCTPPPGGEIVDGSCKAVDDEEKKAYCLAACENTPVTDQTAPIAILC